MSYDAGTRNRKKTDYIVVHCSASVPSEKTGAKDIDRWHRQRGFRCLGYHYVIKVSGEVEEGRPTDQIGAHVEGYNESSVGICLVGGVSKEGKSENNFSKQQFESLFNLIKTLKFLYPKAVVQGHRDFHGVKKDCPCFDVREWLKNY